LVGNTIAGMNANLEKKLTYEEERQIAQKNNDTILYADPTRLDDFAEALYTVVMCDMVAYSHPAQTYKDRLALFCWKKSAREMLALFARVTRD